MSMICTVYYVMCGFNPCRGSNQERERKRHESKKIIKNKKSREKRQGPCLSNTLLYDHMFLTLFHISEDVIMIVV